MSKNDELTYKVGGFMKLPKLGMRNIKTGLAVMVCIIVSKYMVENPMYSTVACIISMQDTVKGSVKAGFNRVKGTIIGGIVGYLMVLLNPGDPILCGIGAMITIYMCNLFKLNNAITVASVTFASIHMGVIVSDPARYSIFRVIDTSIGVLVAIVINYIIARPDYLNIINDEFIKIEKISKNFVKSKIINKEKINITKFEKDVKKLDTIYKKLEDELNYSKDEVNLEEINKMVSVCKEIYYHMQSIELLEKKLYLNKENYEDLKKLYKTNKIDWEIDEEESPVFNYHLSKIIDEINILKSNNKKS